MTIPYRASRLGVLVNSVEIQDFFVNQNLREISFATFRASKPADLIKFKGSKFLNFAVLKMGKTLSKSIL